MENVLEVLGMTQEEIQERVIDRMVEQIMTEETSYYDEDTGKSYKETRQSQMERQLRKLVQSRIDAQVTAVADEHLAPRIREIIESTKLQETTKWGEKKGEPLTFIEYLVTRAEVYLKEQVNERGETRADRDYNWNGVQTRLAFLVHSDLHKAIQSAVSDAIGNAHKLFATSLQDMVNAQLTEIAGKIKLSVQAGK
jgi:hypothetical protein